MVARPISCKTKLILFYIAFETITMLSLKSIFVSGDKEACNLGLGRSAPDATLLTFSLEGASPRVLANQFTRKKMKKSLLKKT
jgi:hypothetical protein